MSVNSIDVEARQSGGHALWHAGFLKIILAHFLVGVSIYMFLPVAPLMTGGADGVEAGGALAAVLWFCVGMCVPAPFCNYWLDAYRRKGVALWALAGMACSVLFAGAGFSGWAGGLVRLLQGASYGVFQIAVGSTLLLDLSDTRKRTEAAHVYYWFQRLALVVGLLVGRVVAVLYGRSEFLWIAAGLLLAALLLVGSLRVPFRAPLQPALFTLDRFFLPRGFRLFVPLLLSSAVAGLLLGQVHALTGFLGLCIGLWLALSLHLRLFGERLELELSVGFLLLLGASLLFLSPLSGHAVACVSSLCLGCGLGCIASRYLLSFIRICEHCERGTAQTSYLLGWDVGILSGYSFSSLMWTADERICTYVLLGLCLSVAVFHFVFVRKWYVRHRRK